MWGQGRRDGKGGDICNKGSHISPLSQANYGLAKPSYLQFPKFGVLSFVHAILSAWNTRSLILCFKTSTCPWLKHSFSGIPPYLPHAGVYASLLCSRNTWWGCLSKIVHYTVLLPICSLLFVCVIFATVSWTTSTRLFS